MTKITTNRLITLVILGLLFLSTFHYLNITLEKRYWQRYVKEKHEAMGELYYREFISEAEEVSLEELIELFGNETLIPTWMPDDIKLRKIYVVQRNESMHAILAYSDREIEDYRNANIIISIVKPSAGLFISYLKSDEEYNDGNYTNGELIKINDMWLLVYDERPGIPVTITLENGREIKFFLPEPQPATAYFCSNAIGYTLWGFFSKDVIIMIVKNMKPYSQIISQVTS